MKETTEVLIVGAGPSGLAAAAFLHALGLRIRIVDKNPNRSEKSKALGIQAGTLECFEHVLGKKFVNSLIESGQPVKKANIHLNKLSPIPVNLAAIPSNYNFILILDQSKTERILEEHLASVNVRIERKTEAISLENHDTHVITQLKTAADESFSIQSDFVIGCDGAHSTIRELLEIPFKGSAYAGNFILADVDIEWPWDYASIHTFISAKGNIACFPLGQQHYRLILILRDSPQNQTSLSFSDLQQIVAKLSHQQIKLSTPSWLTRFRIHHRMVTHFQKGRTFLAGDAAHIHSPVGGQGMNIGIQDSFNLAHKIFSVLRQQQPVSILGAYEHERYPVARKVLRNTDRIFRLALLRENFFTASLRENIVRRAAKALWLQKRLVKAISQVDDARLEIQRVSSSPITKLADYAIPSVERI